ncbi:sugar-binding domain-containing protein [Rapidithrix thailandica]|uniref:beta-galactosidase n=1 Tax=Rapidithrix thailandica TaxID=413964 RepID=A0AAW9SAU5_9BACT
MKREIKKCWVFIYLVLSYNLSLAQDYHFSKEEVHIIGRGSTEWKENHLSIKDCFIALKEQSPENFEMSFFAKAPNNAEQVQIWSGFGFQDRNNRYALGLRGGNNNDLYLCRYQSNAKNEMLALESLDFQPKPGETYKIRIIFWEGNIRVYLNEEERARIIVKDKEYLKGGTAVLGGGWIRTDYQDLNIKQLTTKEVANYSADTLKYSKKLTQSQKEKLRAKQRTNYRGHKIKKLSAARNEVALNGDWLFMPGYQIKPDGDAPYAVQLNDENWHVMQVPSFWNPVRNWLHLQDSGLPHRGSGLSDNYRENEESRCEAYTFDYTKTNSAWYRHWIELPKKLEGKRYSLHFDAVSKIADVYVNGQYVGGHIGMFGDFAFDITDVVKPGKNIIAVGVKVRKNKKAANADQNVTKAVSVDVTNDMLNSLPFGMFNGDEGGIWQEVKLVVTQATYIKDVYANITAKGGTFEISINNTGQDEGKIDVKLDIIDPQTHQPLSISESRKRITIQPGTTAEVHCKTGTIRPKLWSPEQPNLYTLVTSLYQQGKLIDTQHTTIGFRTFEARGNQFYLNGRPYWVRGANHPPCGIAPNDRKLANTFFKLMHEGNQMMTRSHGSPFTKAWMDAADTQGVGVSYEGSWPWLMIGNIPSQELLDVWKEEMLSLVKKYRNHPSLLIWTVNNEMYFTMFYHNDPPEIRIKKWEILSEVIKEIRKLSPNTVISADSGYGRVLTDYQQNLKPLGIDDGDIDDRHVYFNWYNRDFFQIIDGEWSKRIYWSPGANTNRPFFSQETSTGYTNNDSGHFNRKYLFKNYVPQAWVGDWAYEDKDPTFTLQRHAFMTKELMEVIRRTSPASAGVLLFANVCWFRNVYDADRITPYPVYDAVKKASNPVLVSAELFGRNFYAGSTIKPRVCIVNDANDGNAIPTSQLKWAIEYQGTVLHEGVQDVPSVPHYQRKWMELEVNLPESLPVSKATYQLVLTLHTQGQTLSANTYDLTIAEKQWVSTQHLSENKKIAVFDLTGETCKVLDFLGLKYQKISDLTAIRFIKADLLIIANLDTDEEVPYNWEDVKKVCGNGSNVLLVHPGKHLQWLYYNKIESLYERKGRVVNMHIPEHEAFEGIGPLELAWWQQVGREKPRACRRSFRLKNPEDANALCTYLRPHTGLGSAPEDYLSEMSGIPLMEITEKKGRLIASEMETNMADQDPVAAKLFINLIKNLTN